MKYFYKGFALMAAVLLVLVLPLVRPVVSNAEGTITYDFSGIAIPEGQPCILTVDEGTIGVFRVMPDMVNAFVDALAQRYDNGANVINKAAEVQYIHSVLLGLQPFGVHKPIYSTLQAQTGGTVAGSGTYVDVNKTSQTLSYFVEGVLVYSTPVVTGNVSKGYDTPNGIFRVNTKERERWLRGKNYKSYVHYWMQIHGNYGIHDATWRSSFGGNIYKTNGSHGCINIPPANMPALFNAMAIGTPVVVHE